MFRLLPWSSAVGGNKVTPDDFNMLATPSKRAATNLSGLARPQLKRKRTESDLPAPGVDSPLATKARADNNADGEASANGVRLSSQPPAAPRNSSTSTSTDTPSFSSSPSESTATECATRSPKMDVGKLREIIESQLSLEILLKHNELRLIDQEMAKCQIALEQLRRCAEIPYPGSPSIAGLSHPVRNGSGTAAVSTPGNGPAPLSPAPWRITDGPYTSHYAAWLLPDPRFDGGGGDDVVVDAVPGGQLPVEGRTTRGNSGGDGGSVSGKARPQRGSTGAKLQALPNGYPQPKERAGPMVIRRKSDGVFVKLVCLDCRRDNFSSTQGFINHCRIAHNRNFASHDAAATASGEPVEVDGTGAVAPGQCESSGSATSPGYVHPLVRSAHVIESTPKPNGASGSVPRRRSRIIQSSTADTLTRATGQSRTETRNGSKSEVNPNSSFSASPDAPHLSSLMQHKGVGVDLGQLVGDAKITVDIDLPSEGEPEDELDADAESAQAPESVTSKDKSTRNRQPARTTMSQAIFRRPCSRKGTDNESCKTDSLKMSASMQPAPYESPYGPVAASSSRLSRADGVRDATDYGYGSANLSPNTIESNQAPSLVSDDDDDYDVASDSDNPSSNSYEVEEDDQQFGHIEVGDDEVTSASATTDLKKNPDLTNTASKHAASLSKPLKSLKRGSVTKKQRRVYPSTSSSLDHNKGERRVNFVSPDTGTAKGKSGTNRRSSQGQL